MVQTLQSYVGGEWVAGSGDPTQLFDPTTEEVIAHTSTGGIDTAAAVDYAHNPSREKPATGAVYGGLPRGDTAIREMVAGIMMNMLDAQQDVPPLE